MKDLRYRPDPTFEVRAEAVLVAVCIVLFVLVLKELLA